MDVRYVLGSKEVTLDWDKSSLAFNADPEVDSGAEGYLFRSDPFYPGWQAQMDGEPVPILRADYAFRAVAAGTHTVTMTFRPATWYAGLGISAFTVALLLILGTWALVRKRRQRA